MRNISPHHCPNPLQFLIFDSETANEPVLHEKFHVPLTKTVVRLLGGTANSQLTLSRNFCKAVGENVPSASLTTVTQLHVTKNNIAL
jgi:hypothetical protein